MSAFNDLFEWCRKNDGISIIFNNLFNDAKSPQSALRSIFELKHEPMCRAIYASLDNGRPTINQEIEDLEDRLSKLDHYATFVKSTRAYVPTCNPNSCECGCGSNRSSDCKYFNQSLYECDYCDITSSVKRNDFITDVAYNEARYQVMTEHIIDVYGINEDVGYMMNRMTYTRQLIRHHLHELGLNYKDMTTQHDVCEFAMKSLLNRYGPSKLILHTNTQHEFIRSVVSSYW
jgi:hypothetical protein